MIKKCLGCGSIMQHEDENLNGFVDEENFEKSLICKRCFRIKNYGDYKFVSNNKEEYQKIFDYVKKKNELVLFLCDILTLDDSIAKINDFSGNAILVITKKDLLPKSVKEKKIIEYIKKNYKLNFKNIIFVSSNKNYNIDLLYEMILKFKKGSNVYLVGNTNAGKSSLINALIKSYSSLNIDITTSILPSTTLDSINIKLNDDIFLIDTPGLINDNNYINDVSISDVKKIVPKVEIKPRTYQMKPNESLLIDNYARIDYLSNEKNSFTLYLSNSIKVKRIKLNTNNELRNLNMKNFNLDNKKDIVINGLCFCKITNKANVNIYVKSGVNVFERDNLI